MAGNNRLEIEAYITRLGIDPQAYRQAVSTISAISNEKLKQTVIKRDPTVGREAAKALDELQKFKYLLQEAGKTGKEVDKALKPFYTNLAQGLKIGKTDQVAAIAQIRVLTQNVGLLGNAYKKAGEEQTKAAQKAAEASQKAAEAQRKQTAAEQKRLLEFNRAKTLEELKSEKSLINRVIRQGGLSTADRQDLAKAQAKIQPKIDKAKLATRESELNQIQIDPNLTRLFNTQKQNLADQKFATSALNKEVKQLTASLSYLQNQSVVNKNLKAEIPILENALRKAKNTLDALNKSQFSSRETAFTRGVVNRVNSRGAYSDANLLGRDFIDTSRRILKEQELQAAASEKSQKGLNKQAKAYDKAKFSAAAFGDQIGLAIKRFSAFLIGSAPIFVVISAFTRATEEALKFERGQTRLAQILGTTRNAVKAIGEESLRQSRQTGTKATDIQGGVDILAQAGIQDPAALKQIQPLIARIPLTAIFGGIEETLRGIIAINGQFNRSIGETERTFDILNKVAGDYAVEVRDIFDGIKRGGGAFATTGGTLEEFIQLYSLLKSKTQESSESLGTFFKTISGRAFTGDFEKLLISLGQDPTKLTTSVDRLQGLRTGFVNKFGPDLKDPSIIASANQAVGVLQGARLVALLQAIQQDAGKITKSLNSSDGSFLRETEKAAGNITTSFQRLQRALDSVISSLTENEFLRGSFKLIADGAELVGQFGSAISGILPLFAGLLALKVTPSVTAAFGGIGNRFFNPGRAVLAESQAAPIGFDTGTSRGIIDRNAPASQFIQRTGQLPSIQSVNQFANSGNIFTRGSRRRLAREFTALASQQSLQNGVLGATFTPNEALFLATERQNLIRERADRRARNRIGAFSIGQRTFRLPRFATGPLGLSIGSAAAGIGSQFTSDSPGGRAAGIGLGIASAGLGIAAASGPAAPAVLLGTAVVAATASIIAWTRALKESETEVKRKEFTKNLESVKDPFELLIGKINRGDISNLDLANGGGIVSKKIEDLVAKGGLTKEEAVKLVQRRIASTQPTINALQTLNEVAANQDDTPLVGTIKALKGTRGNISEDIQKLNTFLNEAGQELGRQGVGLVAKSKFLTDSAFKLERSVNNYFNSLEEVFFTTAVAFDRLNKNSDIINTNIANNNPNLAQLPQLSTRADNVVQFFGNASNVTNSRGSTPFDIGEFLLQQRENIISPLRTVFNEPFAKENLNQNADGPTKDLLSRASAIFGIPFDQLKKAGLENGAAGVDKVIQDKINPFIDQLAKAATDFRGNINSLINTIADLNGELRNNQRAQFDLRQTRNKFELDNTLSNIDFRNQFGGGVDKRARFNAFINAGNTSLTDVGQVDGVSDRFISNRQRIAAIQKEVQRPTGSILFNNFGEGQAGLSEELTKLIEENKDLQAKSATSLDALLSAQDAYKQALQDAASRLDALYGGLISDSSQRDLVSQIGPEIKKLLESNRAILPGQSLEDFIKTAPGSDQLIQQLGDVTQKFGISLDEFINLLPGGKLLGEENFKEAISLGIRQRASNEIGSAFDPTFTPIQNQANTIVQDAEAARSKLEDVNTLIKTSYEESAKILQAQNNEMKIALEQQYLQFNNFGKQFDESLKSLDNFNSNFNDTVRAFGDHVTQFAGSTINTTLELAPVKFDVNLTADKLLKTVFGNFEKDVSNKIITAINGYFNANIPLETSGPADAPTP